MHPIHSYLICATPRSGSTLLCEALTNTGVAGNPKEYFESLKASGLPRRPREYFTTIESPEIAELLGDHSRLDEGPNTILRVSNYADYLAQVLEEGTTPNGVFGAKLMWGYFDDFISNLRDIPSYRNLPLPELLSTIFPDLHYIWVTRSDKVRQAVSLWKAIQTWTWREDEGPSAQLNHHEEHPRFNHHERHLRFHFEAIYHLVQQIIEHEQAWQRYFDQSAIQPYTVIYEDLAANYETSALQILHYLGIPIPKNPVFAERRMKRQADGLSEEWVDQYHNLKRQQACV